VVGTRKRESFDRDWGFLKLGLAEVRRGLSRRDCSKMQIFCLDGFL
jgi:hypothetical protein